MAASKTDDWTLYEIEVAVQCNYVPLFENMRPTEVIQILFQKGVLKQGDKQKLDRRKENKGEIAQARLLLDIILKVSCSNLYIFIAP